LFRSSPSTAMGGLSSASVTCYLANMEQFLDVQREIMEAYLASRNGTPIAAAPGLPSFALLGQIEHLEPGRHVVIRRRLDEREDLYAADHTLGGRGVSQVNPAQNGLPVLPMTFSLEAMAE